jgi:DNA-binding PadR family transcriptional regulator
MEIVIKKSTKKEMVNIKKIKKYSPLTETTFYILISLLEPLHGYGIMQKVEKLSNGRIKLAPGTLYGALGNLMEARMIELEDSRRAKSRKKVYHIKQLGVDMIRFELERLEEIIENGRLLLNKKGK